MTIFNLGSINRDLFYSVPHLPRPGETLAATAHSTGLGGKGANQSVAAARAGSQVVHIGSVGPDGAPLVAELRDFGVDCAHVSTVETATAHAIITVDDAGENAIVIFSGANLEQSLTHVESAISAASQGDILMLQNETNLQAEAARMAHEAGLFVIYSAAPFEAAAVQAILPFTDLLVMNALEAKQLTEALSTPLESLGVRAILVTRGADGASWIEQGAAPLDIAAFPVTPVDTTGAGDCHVGYLAAGLDQGLAAREALRRAAAASALQVTRHGTAGAIPSRGEVDAFLENL